MFPSGMNPRQMRQMMKQFGIKAEEIPANRVIFELADGGKIVINEPDVSAVDMQGKKTYTVAGEASVEEGVSAEDVSMVAESAGVDEDAARAALEENDGDLAKAIASLK